MQHEDSVNVTPVAACPHDIQRCRKDEAGIFCEACGIKVYGVEPRECQGCRWYRRLSDGSICRKHLMAVTPTMHVTFALTEGTCWTDPAAPPPPAYCFVGEQRSQRAMNLGVSWNDVALCSKTLHEALQAAGVTGNT
jgi:hypothetical protein